MQTIKAGKEEGIYLRDGGGRLAANLIQGVEFVGYAGDCGCDYGSI